MPARGKKWRGRSGLADGERRRVLVRNLSQRNQSVSTQLCRPTTGDGGYQSARESSLEFGRRSAGHGSTAANGSLVWPKTYISVTLVRRRCWGGGCWTTRAARIAPAMVAEVGEVPVTVCSTHKARGDEEKVGEASPEHGGARRGGIWGRGWLEVGARRRPEWFSGRRR